MGAGSDLACNLIEMELHGGGVAVGQDQAGAGAPCRTDGAKYIGRAGALIVCQTRPATLARPQIGELVLLAHPHLVLEPDFDGGGGVGLGADLRHLAGKVFLKAARVSSLCLYALGRALTWLNPRLF